MNTESAEWAQTPKRVGKDNKRVGKDTSWAQRHRVGRKSQRVQKDRVATNTASSHKHRECAQAEWAEKPTKDRERSK